MKKKIKRLFIFTPLIVLLCIFLYSVLCYYFSGSFGPNTWINGVYCTGQTVEDINRQLIAEKGTPLLTVKGFDGREYCLDASEINYSYDYRLPIYVYLDDLNPMLWFWYSLEGQSLELAPNINFDEEKVEQWWNSLEFVAQETAIPYELQIPLTDAGYVLVDGYHNRYDMEAAYNFFLKELDTGSTYIDVSAMTNDMSLQTNDSYADDLLLWQKIEEFQTTGIVYDMGDEQIALSGRIAAGFIQKDENGFVLDESGNLILDEAAVTTFIKELAAEYDTVDKAREWTTYDGRTVTVPAGTYGTEINQTKEVAFILDNFSTKEELVHIPAYKTEPYVRGKDDIGSDYVEIDMSNQKLLVIQNGEITIETDIVTGDMKRKRSTPEGMYYVYAKQRNRTLRGDDYTAFVSYWMPVNGNIGLHDASWRKKFGGDIYLTDGSHGCVNIPKAITPDIYAAVEIGMPVIMYY